MARKLISTLCRSDLGKKVKYQFGEGSVLVGVLEAVQHYQSNNLTYVTIAGTQQSASDAEATIEFV